jgi:hypothetical protein
MENTVQYREKRVTRVEHRIAGKMRVEVVDQVVDSEPDPRRIKPATVSPATFEMPQNHRRLLYSYILKASFSKASASMNRGTTLHSKGTGRLRLLVSPSAQDKI